MRTTDNNNSKSIIEIKGNPDISVNEISDLKQIGNHSIKSLIDNNNDLLIFPSSLNEYGDGLEDESANIFTLNEEHLLTTFNIMGFVGRNDTKLTISSRFSSNENDYFLHYMLQKVFAINILNFDQKKGEENIWDFLLYLFPFLLKKALSQGLYKEYQHNEYNDANVKGTIDISRNIRINNPFMGKIAYRTRAHSYDNPITQLIRHTVEHIRNHIWGNSILNNDVDTKNAVNQIVYATPTFEKNKLQKTITQNARPVNHPFFTEYLMLQKICIKILRHEGITFGKEKDKIYGLLFDGAWLWEEYLNTILKDLNYIHPRNKGKSGDKNPIYLFSGNSYPRYPDFYHNGKKIVLDAKYKHSENRNDMHQIISYMHIRAADIGGFIYPQEELLEKIEINPEKIGELNGHKGIVNRYAFPICNQSYNFHNFTELMKKTENSLKIFCQ